ncbi:ABC transporter substrate-binding protein [Bradyrhizobium sp. CSA207]|uniref:ABC transporter substrate-binding protein n=1 Tax=Bradyrhizobium sp. CSA207 TaxID=2698826 RepID=UPI0023B05F02|nr:ABC transporter substrate-binding protein [Bradyrhizobium sp. CSA207]MDE5443288.1 ABC transporter substrate-binding protein [Bradyrhizobium sp. CSA207]
MSRLAVFALAIVVICGSASAQSTEKKYGPGVTDHEIKLGQTVPYSGPVSAAGALGQGALAYFEKVNREKGGVNGRKIKLISLDDAYSPPKAVEQTRKLVEEEGVLAIVGSAGSPTGVAVQAYLNKAGVPQVLQISGSRKFNDPKHSPWSTGLFIPFYTEGQIFGKLILKYWPNAKIAVLHPNDELGREYLAGLRSGLGDKADTMIVRVVTYEDLSPTIDSQVAQLSSSRADLFFNAAVTKFASQSIRRAREMGWNVRMIVPSISGSIGQVIKPAGVQNAKGLISALWQKDPSDSRWLNDKDVKDYLKFVKTYLPGVNPDEMAYSTGYMVGELVETILKRCGDDLTRENVMKQATNLKGISLVLGLPESSYENSPEDYNLIRNLQIVEFDGEKWTLFAARSEN